LIEQRRRALEADWTDRPLVVAAGSTIRPDVLGAHLFRDDALATAAVKLLGRGGFDAVALGLFDFGAVPRALARYMRLMRDAGMPLMAANVGCSDRRDFRCRLLAPRYRVLRRGGLRVGVLGVVRDDLIERIIERARRTLRVAPAVETARHWIRVLRQKERVDLVVALANVNSEGDSPQAVLHWVERLGRDRPEITVTNAMFTRGGGAVDGSDYLAEIRRGDGALIVGTDRFAQTLGEVIVSYRRDGDRVRIEQTTLRQHRAAGVRADPQLQAAGRRLLARVCRALDKPLGSGGLARPLSRREFIGYLMEIVRRRAGAEVALLNESAIADTSFPMRGVLTEEKLLRAIRTETRVGTIGLSGGQLMQLVGPHLSRPGELHALGLTRSGDQWLVNERPLVAGQIYRVATTAFVAGGGDRLVDLGAGFDRSEKTLRQVALDFFVANGAGRDGDPRVDPERDFPRLADRWLLTSGLRLGVNLGDVSVHNGDDGDRYSLPLLKRDHLTSLNLELRIDLGAATRDHQLQSQLELQYGRSWTRQQGLDPETGAQRETVEAESLDRLLAVLSYRLRILRNRYKYRYLPEPFVEALLTSEFTASGSYEDAAGERQTYHYADLAGTVGLGFELMPLLFAKVGFVKRGELFTPAEAQPDKVSTEGLYLGYNLERWALIADTEHPLQLESRLDFYFTDPGASRRSELTVQTKLLFALTRLLQLDVTHRLFVFDKASDSASLANDITVGLALLFDHRHQTF
jgi:2',3'-cyclic-nucleotide 2'-phosphodiesterase (5'-nucleotidase family)